MNKVTIFRFDDRKQLDQALSTRIAQQLNDKLAQTERASIALSGGSTPLALFEQLSHTALNWQNIDITLVDDRIVPSDHTDSNERALREHLLTNQAAKARFVSLCQTLANDDHSHINDNALNDIHWPLAICVLGMGTDGHTASWFADAPELAEALEPRRKQHLAITTPAQAPHQRITLTRPAVLSSDMIILHICEIGRAHV